MIRHAHRPRPLVDALRVLCEGAVLVFVVAAWFVALWLGTP